ncbi:hypothetical protein [Staphylococcus carnosus]|uniref:hypothetical protein n=1 Tax=Staphylococcus carnosus TaxID=1281 RepID=UPI003F9E1FFF
MGLKKYAHKIIDMLDESEIEGYIEYSKDPRQTLIFAHYDVKYNSGIRFFIVSSQDTDDEQLRTLKLIEKLLSDRKKVSSNA